MLGDRMVCTRRPADFFGEQRGVKDRCARGGGTAGAGQGRARAWRAPADARCPARPAERCCDDALRCGWTHELAGLGTEGLVAGQRSRGPSADSPSLCGDGRAGGAVWTWDLELWNFEAWWDDSDVVMDVGLNKVMGVNA